MIERHSIKDLPNLQRKRHKYGVKQDEKAKGSRTFRGILYASRIECLRAIEHDALSRSSKYDYWWTRQVPFWLGAGGFKYIADFLVWNPVDGGLWAEDVKGAKTDRYNDIMKMWAAYGELPLRILGYKRERFYVIDFIHPRKHTND